MARQTRRRGVRALILGEDQRHEGFARRVLRQLGFHSHREIRVVDYPIGKDSAEAWVRKQYPKEVRGIRQRGSFQNVALLVIIDADQKSVSDRKQQLDRELRAGDLSARSEADPIVVWVPKRHIETWVAFLRGHEVNESHERHECKRLVTADDVGPAADRFVYLLRHNNDRPADLLHSLSDAFVETERLPG